MLDGNWARDAKVVCRRCIFTYIRIRKKTGWLPTRSDGGAYCAFVTLL
jgi:hypothetical protein